MSDQYRYFSIRNMKPAPYNIETQSRKKTRDWQDYLADKLQNEPKVQNLPASTRFAVDLIFIFTNKNAKNVDLDNLAKPVLDVFFISQGYPPFHLCYIEDSAVFDLRVRKVGLDIEEVKDEGVDIILTW